MANTSKKVNDPTEVALSAIQEALSMGETDTDTNRASAARSETAPKILPPPLPTLNEPTFEAPVREEPAFESMEQPHAQRHAANDDREAIGQALQALQQGRPTRSVYLFATVFAGIWLVGCAALTVSFWTSLQAATGESGGVLVVAGLAAMFLAPVLLFFSLANLASRGQEMRMIAQAMAQVAIRFSEPEAQASDSMVTVGQAVRREVAAMGDGIERAIARAGELETLVATEVAALERAYTDNEVRIRALLQDIAHQRDNLVGQSEQVRSAISEVQVDLRQDIELISEAITSRVDEVAKSITTALEERGTHITQALGNVGDNMIFALGDRGGDLLDRLEQASSETTRAVLDASERLTASLNFKTDHVQDEFVELADRVHEMLNERIDRVIGEFEQRSSAIVDGISTRTEQVHDSLKNSGDSLLLELELRSNDLSSKIGDAGNRLSDQIMTSGEKASESLDTTVNTLVTRVVQQTETAHDSLSLQMSAFEELVTNQGSTLVEKFARDSGTLGALITRHIAEFDHTVKTFGGEIVDRMGQRTNELNETLKTCVDTFETRFSSNGIATALDERLTRFETVVEERVSNLDNSLDSKVVHLDNAIEGHIKTLDEQFGSRVASITQTFDTRANSVTEAIDERLGTLATSLTDGAAQAVQSIDTRLTHFTSSLTDSATQAVQSIDTRLGLLTSALTDGTAHAVEAVDHSVTSATEMINVRSAHLTDTVTARFQEFYQTIETKAGSIADDIGVRVAQFEDLLGSRVEAVTSRIENSGRQASDELTSRAETITTTIRSHVEEAEHSLTNLAVNTSEAIQHGARTAQQSLMTVSSEVNAQLKLISSDVERALTAVGTGAANSIVVSARDAQVSLVSASTEAANQIKALSENVHTALSTASSEATNNIKTLTSDVERSLSLAGTTTTDAITASAREAHASLTSASTDVVSQIRAISTEVERSLGTACANATDGIQTTAINAHNVLIKASDEASSRVKSSSADIERSVLAASGAFGSAMTAKTDEIVTSVQQQADRLSNMIDSKHGLLVDAIGATANQLATDIDRVTTGVLNSIETRSRTFAQTMVGNGDEVARTVNLASESATRAISKSLNELEQASRTAIEQSRQVSISTVTEMKETNTILRTDTVALFERLREGNILLQEVLTGAHDNLNSLERALVTRVADFVSAMNDANTRNGAATRVMEEQLEGFNVKAMRTLEGLSQLSTQFDEHGKALVDAAAMVELSNRNTTASLSERKQALESLVTTIDGRTNDLGQRLSRFTNLLDESLAAAEERARDIARVVAETAGSGSATITRQLDAVRVASEAKHRQTVEAMHEIYRQTTSEADAMFKQSAEKFSNLVLSMKQMALEMHNELEATRNELRRGVMEMPQEAAESTAQMRKVIVDQIEALAELNRIVAQHGRGLDVATSRTSVQHQEEPMYAAASTRNERRTRDSGSASTLPPPDLGMPAPRRTEAPPVSPESSDQGRNGWLSDLLNRADADPGRDALRSAPQPMQTPRGGGNPLESLSLDIGRLMDRNLAAEMWDRYQHGETKALTKRIYTPAGQKAFDEVARKYRSDRNFRQTVDRYITEFERLLDEIAHDGRRPQDLRNHLTSETGLVYTLLAQAAGRLT